MYKNIRRFFTCLLAFIMLAATLPMSLPTFASEPVNLIANPGFETPDSAWLVASHSKVLDLWEYDSTEKNGGNYSLKAVSAKSTQVTYDLSLSQYVDVDPLKIYSFSVWMKSSSATVNAAIQIRECVDKSNDGSSWFLMNNSRNLVSVTSTTGWTKYTFNIMGLKSTTKYARVYCLFQMNGKGTVWFDDLSMTEYDTSPTSGIGATIPEGTVAGNTVVKLNPVDENSNIYFTTDGSDPNTSETRIKYSDEYGVIITEDTVISAVELKENETEGQIKLFRYKCTPLVTNGGFESGGGWTAPEKGWTVTDSDFHTGSKCMMGVSSDKTTYIQSNFVYLNPKVYEYELSFWYKTENITNDSFHFSILQSDGSSSLGWYGGEVKGFFVAGVSNGWTQFKSTLGAISEKTTRMRLYARLEKNCGGTAWIDDIKLTAIQNGLPEGNGAIAPSLKEGEVKKNAILKLKPSAKKADIIYTLDGSDPHTSATAALYSAEDGIIITEDAEIKAYSCEEGGEPSEVQTFNYACEPLIIDGGFENGTSKWVSAEATSGWVQDNTVFHSGKSSASANSKFSSDVLIYTPQISINSGYRYELSFWLKSDDVQFADGFSINIIQGAGGATKGWYNGQIKGLIVSGGTQDWTKYTYLLDEFYDNTVNTLRVYARLSAGSRGKVWIDDFSLKAVQNEFYPIEQIEKNTSTTQGNIYTETLNKAVDYTLRLANNSQQKQEFTLESSVYFADTGEILSSNASELSLKAGSKVNRTISLGEIRFYGNYRLDVTISGKNGNYSYTKSYYLSRIRSSPTTEMTDEQRLDSGYAAAVHLGHWGFEYKKIVDQAVLAGSSWIRDGMRWYNVEKSQKGVYEFASYWDDYLSYAKERGLKVNMAVSGGNMSLYGSQSNSYMPETEEQIEGFANFVAAAALKYKDYISAIELFNEYNSVNFNPANASPETYAATTKRVYERVKAVVPDMKIICGATSGIDVQWFKRVFDAGAYDYCDVISVHPYVDNLEPERYLKRLNSLKELMAGYGELKPVWATEFGYTTYINSAEVYSPGYEKNVSVLDKEEINLDVVDSAAYASRVYIMMQSGIFEKVFWYSLINNTAGEYNIGCTAPFSKETNFGLSRGFADRQSPLAAKSSLISISATHSLLLNAKCTGETVLDENLTAYHFVKDDNSVITAIWLSGAAVSGKYMSAEIKASSGDAVYYDVYGNAIGVIGSEGDKIKLTSATVFIEGEFTLNNLGIFFPSSEDEPAEDNTGDTDVITDVNPVINTEEPEDTTITAENEQSGSEGEIKTVVTRKKKRVYKGNGKKSSSDGIFSGYLPYVIALSVFAVVAVSGGTVLIVFRRKKKLRLNAGGNKN